MAETLLTVENLHTTFHTRQGIVPAVDGISFQLQAGETLGIVGESGSGKSVTCYSLLGLLPQPTGRIESGQALFHGQDLLKLSEKELQKIRGRRIAMIFQDPMTSLNPYLRISDQLVEPLIQHTDLKRPERKALALEALRKVGIADAEQRWKQYPHQFSGGMRQRVMIAMALITQPEILIADEPTTALDVTVQAQIMELIKERQQALGMSVILVTHDLGVVAGNCDKVAVMYAGQMVEMGSVEQIFYNPLHAYTKALKQSIPSGQTKGEPLYSIPGQPPQLTRIRPPCAFAPRSSLTFSESDASLPAQYQEIEPGHWVEVHPASMENWQKYYQ